jgi:hypothetical protein
VRGNHDDAPARHWTDAFCAGNGQHGALVFGDPYDETVIVNHHALTWPDTAPPPAGGTPPRLTGRMDRVRGLLLAGQPERALALLARGWPEYHPRRFHPAFAVRTCAGGADAGTGTDGYLRSLDYRTGVASAVWRDQAAGARWRRDCFVSREHDVVAQRVSVSPGPAPLLRVRHDVLLPGAPPGLGVSVRVRSRARGEAAVTVRVAYPDPGRGGYVGVTRIVSVGGECLPDGDDVRVTGWSQLWLLTRVAAVGEDANPDAVAEDLLAAIFRLPATHGDLLAAHARRHQAAFGDVRIDLDALDADRALPVGALLARQAAQADRPLPALLERLFDSGRYLLLSASGMLPPRLPGLWQGDWDSAWSGAITCNANLNLQLAGAVTAQIPAAVVALADMIRDRLPDWRANASRVFGARGIVAPAHSDGTSGLSSHFSADYPHQIWTAGADWLLVPLLDYADATGDEEFLHNRVLPAATELAAFYEDFLTQSDDAGRAVLVPSYSPENAPGGRCPLAINATMDIAAARHALTTAAGVSDDERAARRWRALAEKLPPYRVNDDGALAEWAWPPASTGMPPLPENYGHRHVSHLYPVWPLHEITVADTPGLAAAALRALRLRGPENDSAHGYLHQALAAARLHDADLAGRLLMALTGSGFFFRSLMSSHYPAQSVWNADAACALPGLLIEMLVDSVPSGASRRGRIELLPAVPAFLPSGRLRGVRTLTGVVVADLRWDATAGHVEAELVSRTDQQVELSCGIATCCTAPRGSPRRLRQGTWLAELPEGSAVRIELEIPPRPAPARDEAL